MIDFGGDFDIADHFEGAVDDDDLVAESIEAAEQEDEGPNLDLHEMLTALDVTAGEIAILGRERYYSLIDAELKEDANAIARWTQFAEGLFEICQRQIETPWEELAERLFRAVNPPPKPGDQQVRLQDLGKATQLIWSAVVRYMAALIMCEERDEFDAARQYDWNAWVLDRLSPADSKK